MSETRPSMNLLATRRRRPDAQAIVKGNAKYLGLSGVVRFYQTRRGVLVCVEISGLPEAVEPCGNRIFTFHIHSGSQCTGDSTDPFADALTHYNTGNCPHLAHAGDLVPLFSNHGYAFEVFLTDRFTVCEIVGRTVIVHSGPDDFTTQPSGDAWSKIACGQIRAMAPR